MQRVVIGGREFYVMPDGTVCHSRQEALERLGRS